jgi:hypothetical protein
MKAATETDIEREIGDATGTEIESRMKAVGEIITAGAGEQSWGAQQHERTMGSSARKIGAAHCAATSTGRVVKSATSAMLQSPARKAVAKGAEKGEAEATWSVKSKSSIRTDGRLEEPVT